MELDWLSDTISYEIATRRMYHILLNTTQFSSLNKGIIYAIFLSIW